MGLVLIVLLVLLLIGALPQMPYAQGRWGYEPAGMLVVVLVVVVILLLLRVI